jgi:hypothetical protein
MTSTSTAIARAAAKAAFTHVMDNVIQNTNVTKALNDNGIEDIVALLILMLTVSPTRVQILKSLQNILSKRVRLDSLKHSSILSNIVMKSII